jgi:hypothetical protein
MTPPPTFFYYPRRVLVGAFSEFKTKIWGATRKALAGTGTGTVTGNWAPFSLLKPLA